MKSGPPSFLLSILQRRFDAFDELEHSFKALKLDAICAIIGPDRLELIIFDITSKKICNHSCRL